MFGLIKKLLFLVLIFVGVTAGLVVASRYVPEERWNGVALRPDGIVPMITSGLQHPLVAQAGSQLRSIQGRVLGIETVATDSANTTTSAQTSEQSLPVKTLEFARYTYCRDVVTSYEKQYPPLTNSP